MTNTIEGLKQKLAQLKELHATGVLPDAQFEEGKTVLERQILDLVLTGTPVSAPAPTAASAHVAASSPSPAPAPAPAGATAAVTTVKPSGLLLAGLAVGVVAIAAAGYLWKGTPTAQGEAEPAQMVSADGKPAPHATGAEQIAAMTEKLAQRLKEKPDDVEGWSMLARSYSVLGRHAEALKAYEKASNLRKDDPTLLADFADSLAVNNNSNLEGEPMKLVDRALRLDPKNLKALYLAGTYAFNKKDYTSAITFWEKLVQVGPPGNVFATQVEPAIAEARNLAGLPPAAKPLDAAPKVGAATPAAASNATVSGTVTLSAALAKQAQPDDTVFVFARAAEGSRMPLAILRKQVKDLPITFTLNDSMAMSPTSALSTAGKVIVGARVSKSGNAMPQAGDLSGQSAPVSVGASGLKIEIKEAVKP
jgi:cytochrome c-type biogenesis protein CcmH